VSLFDRILVPLDGSPLAEAVLPRVTRILRPGETDLVLLRAVVPEVPEVDALTPAAELTRTAERYLREVVSRLHAEGVPARGVVQIGNASEAVVDFAEKERAALVAMSTHGRGGMARWIFGSVTEKVLRCSTTPLLVVRSFGEECRREIKDILVPTDGSPLSLGVLPAVRDLARHCDGRVQLLRVQERTAAGDGGDWTGSYRA